MISTGGFLVLVGKNHEYRVALSLPGGRTCSHRRTQQLLVGNVGDMSGRVAMMPTLSAKNGPTSNVAEAVTEFMTESRVR